MPFHESPGAESFAQAVHALWHQVDETLPTARTVRLCGYSLGARLALGMALSAPSRVDSLVLVGGHMGLESQQAVAARRTADAHWQHVLRTQGTAAFLRAFRQQPVFGPPQPAPSKIAAQAACAREALNPQRLADAFDVLGLAAMPSAWPALSTVRCPVQLVVGERDSKFHALAARAAALLPRATLHVAPHAGHDVLWDAPGFLAQLLTAGVSSCPP